jgi:hypothetical protein
MTSARSVSDVRLGRKLVHGRRVRPVVAVEEVQSVLGRLGLEASRSARSLFRRALSAESTAGAMVRPEEETVAGMLAACGALRVEEKAEGDAAVYHWRPYRAAVVDGRRDEVRAYLGRLDPDQARTELLAATSGVSQIAAERDMLADIPVGDPLRVPGRSATRTTVWSSYDAALRAAAGWWEAKQNGQSLSARELAATRLGWSKAWTPAKIKAFEFLMGTKFEDALETMEPEVRLRGPLSWTSGSTIVDAKLAYPWVSIPARSAQRYGTLDHSAVKGIFVVENLDTFEAICRHSPVTNTWLCLWGHGYVNNSLVGLVKSVKKPIACWADLDAHGISIVGDLQRRSEMTVTPIFMDAILHDESAFLEQNDEQIALAVELMNDGHEKLRELAARVSTTRKGREQETMHHLIPQLQGYLAHLDGETAG